MNVFAPLEKALQQRAEAGTPVQVFFRDDDAADDLPALRRLLQLFQAQQTPLNLAVIPGTLTAAGRALLLSAVEAAPELFELQQHGWQHVNHETTGRKCEFGASRSLAEQFADLQRGQARLNEAFGAHWFPVFVPPWNRCTATTAEALAQLGFRGLSRLRGEAPLAGATLPEIPVTLDLFRWQGGAQLRPPAELSAELGAQVAVTAAPVGVMLHHKVMDETALAFVAALLRVFSQAASVRCYKLQHLLPALI